MKSLPSHLIFALAGFILATMISHGQQEVNTFPQHDVTLSKLLHSFYDFSDLPLYQESYCAQVSSYDTTGGNDDGFSGRFSYIRKNKDSTLVIFDVKGPGEINRIWTPTPSDDSLAFYIDDFANPAFTICYRDLFSGKVFPFVSPLCGSQLGGNYCYLPILFQDQCKIVYRGKKTQFHQIQYRIYPLGTLVKKFNPDLDKDEREALQKIKSTWDRESISVTDLYQTSGIRQLVNSVHLRPGETSAVADFDQGGRILGIELSPASAFKGLNKNIDIRITWDNERYPAVHCPVADFFGYAFGKPAMKSLLIGTEGDRNLCYFPMPFDKSARIEFVYRKTNDAEEAHPINIECRVFFTDLARDASLEGRFYCYWNRNNPARANQPHILLMTGGKGHIVGTVLQAQGLKPGMTYFFEGDDSTAVDGQFRIHGTGSEDYFNGGWYALQDKWDAAMNLPLSGSLDYSLPFCRTGGYRLFLSDKISFEKSIFHSIEHGPVNNDVPVDYTSICYYYCNSPDKFNPSPVNLSGKIFMPDTLILYPQLMNLGIDGEIAFRPEWAYPSGGETFFCTVGNGSGLRISLQEIPHGDYRLFLDFIEQPEGCSFSLWQRQTQISGWTDGFSAESIRNEDLYLSDVRVDGFLQTVTFRFKTVPGKNKFIFNRLILLKK